MNFRNPFILGSTILFLGFATVAIYEAFGIAGIIFLALILIIFTIAIWSTYSRGTLVDEMEVGVIYNRFNNSFSRFVVSPEPGSVRQFWHHDKPKWILFGRRIFASNDPYYVRLRWFEEVKNTIPKKSQTAKGKLENVRTADGTVVSISWKISYTVDVTLIPESILHKMARALPENSDKIISGRTERALKHLLGQRSIQSLYVLNTADGFSTLQVLEQEICQRVNQQLYHPVNLGFKEIMPKDVSLGPIEMPPKIEKELELAHQRRIRTETVASSLERLHKTIAEFSSQDMRRLAELERLRILDEKDIKSLHLIDAFVEPRQSRYYLQQPERIKDEIDYAHDSRVLSLSIDGDWRAFEFTHLFDGLDYLNKVFTIGNKMNRNELDVQLPRGMTRDIVYKQAILYYFLSPREELTVKEIRFASPGKIEFEGHSDPVSKVSRLARLASSNEFVKGFVNAYDKIKLDREEQRNLDRAERKLKLRQVLEEERALERRQTIQQAEDYREFLSIMVDISELSQELERRGLARGDIVEDMFMRSVSFLNRLGEDKKLQVMSSETNES